MEEDDENPMADIMNMFQFGSKKRPENKILLRYSEQELLYLVKEKNLRGTGTKNDPIIIEASQNFPKHDEIYINRSDLYLKLQNCEFKSIRLKRCSNIIFEECQIKYLNITHSAEISIQHCTLGSLSLLKSVHINTSNSDLNRLQLTESFLNSITGGSIKNITKLRSPDNKIEVKNIPEKELQKGERFPANILAFIISSSSFLITLSIIFFSIMMKLIDVLILIMISIFSFCAFFMTITSVVLMVNLGKKVKKFYDHKREIYPNSKKQIAGGILIIFNIILVNLIFINDLKFYGIWWTGEIRNLIFLFSILLTSFIACLGINLLIKANPFNKKNRIVSIPPFYPYFIPVMAFFIPLSITIETSLLLGISSNLGILLSVLLIICACISLLITLATNRRLKISISEESSESFSKYRIIFGLPLIVFGILLMITSFEIQSVEISSSYLPFFMSLLIVSMVHAFLGFNKFASSPSQKLFSAVFSHEKGKYGKSIEQYLVLLKRDPQNKLIWNNLGVAYISIAEFDKAIEAFNKVLELEKDSKYALNGLGKVYFHQKKYDQAIGMFEKALAIPHKPSIAADAIAILKQTFADPVIDDNIMLNLSLAHKEKGDLDTAIKICIKGLDTFPTHKELLNLLGVLYIENKEYDKCMEICQQALIKYPRFENLYNNLGIVYYMKKNFEKAVEMFEKSLDINVKNYEVSFSLAKTHLALNQYKKALKAINLSLRIKPDNPEAIKLRTEIYEKI